MVLVVVHYTSSLVPLMLCCISGFFVPAFWAFIVSEKESKFNGHHIYPHIKHNPSSSSLGLALHGLCSLMSLNLKPNGLNILMLYYFDCVEGNIYRKEEDKNVRFDRYKAIMC